MDEDIIPAPKYKPEEWVIYMHTSRRAELGRIIGGIADKTDKSWKWSYVIDRGADHVDDNISEDDIIARQLGKKRKDTQR